MIETRALGVGRVGTSLCIIGDDDSHHAATAPFDAEPAIAAGRIVAAKGEVMAATLRTGLQDRDLRFAEVFVTGSVRTPFKRHHRRQRVSHPEKAGNHSHANIQALGEPAIVTVKCWKLLAKLHCCPKTGHRTARRDPRPSTRRRAALVSLKTAHCSELVFSSLRRRYFWS
jgi:hypothetical protein